MNIEVLLTEAEIAQELNESLEALDLPEKFFYWLPLSVRAWRNREQGASYRDLARMWELLGAKIGGIVVGFPQVVPVVSLGAGDGDKDRTLIQAIQRLGKTVKYFPVDASQALLETACGAAEDDDIEVLGIKADISSPMHVILASDAAESPKLFLMSGNTLGGFDPLDQLRHIADTMKGGDRLILDAELFRDGGKDEEVAESAKFAFALLASIGVQEEDGQVRFETKQDERHAGMTMTTKFFQAHRDIKIVAAGREVSVARGERLFLNFRYSFTLEAFHWLLKEHAGFTVANEFLSSEGNFIAAVCSC